MPRPTLTPVLLLLLLVTTACSGGDARAAAESRSATAAEVETRISTSGDTTIAMTSGPGLADTAGLAEVWRRRLPPPSAPAPSDSGAAVEAGRAVTALAVASDGTVLAALRGRGIVRVAADGRTESAVTGSDSLGPVAALAVLPDGRVLVRSDSTHRVLRLAPTGAVEAARPLLAGWPVAPRDGLLVDSSGTVWAGLGVRFVGGAPAAFPRAAYQRLTADLRAADTLWIPAYLAQDCPVLSQPHYAADRFEDIRVRYLPKVTWALLPDRRLAVGCPADYGFDVLGPEGAVVRSVKPSVPVTVTKSERASFMTMWLERMKRSEQPQPWGWLDTQLPDRKPAYAALLGSRDGRVWVWGASPSLALGTPATWAMVGLPDTLWVEPPAGVFDVFDRDGRLTAHVRSGEDVGYSPLLGGPDPVIAGDTVWAAVPDSTGWAIARFQLRRP